jgi:hypothetical protein
VNIHQRIVTDEELEKCLPLNFWTKVSPEPNSGCWLWAGATNNTGYGCFWFGGRTWTPHRLLYERLFGPQSGLEIDHLCRVPCCVNPLHLESVTVQENNRRRKDLGKGNRKKTLCPRGHPLSGDNLDVVSTTTGAAKRRCIICRNANDRAYRARRAAKMVMK